MHLTDYELRTKIQKILDGTDPLLHLGLGIITSERDKVVGPFDDFKAKLLLGGELVKDTRSPVQTKQKTQARIHLEPIFNNFQKINIKNNSLISDALKIEWGVHIDSLVRHVIGEGPVSFPTAFDIDKNTPLHLLLHSKSNLTPTSIALPADVSRCDAFVYIFMNADPAHPTPEPEAESQFLKIAETTDDKMEIEFPLTAKGKRVKILLQYFNGKGHGPSSEILDVIVP